MRLLCTLALLLAGCDKDAPADTAYQGGVGTDGDPDDTGEPTGVTLTPACPYEDPPNNFTGGLVQLAFLQPTSGAYAIEYAGNTVVERVGEVDWGAGTVSWEDALIEDFTTVISSGASTFVLQPNGDSTATNTGYRLQLNGEEVFSESSSTKTGCTTVTETYKPETEESSLRVAELVSPSRREWTYDVENSGGIGWTFSSWGVDTDDWTTVYTFETDSPETEFSPDRLGTCENHGDGTTACEMTQYRPDGSYSIGSHTWTSDGDHAVLYEYYDETQEPALRQWGEEFFSYWGAGWRSWTFLQYNTNLEVDCLGHWDDDGIGIWRCNNGDTGTYPR